MSQTVVFGGDCKRSTLFREKLFEELEMFICGCDEGRYDAERGELNHETGKGKEVIISILSSFIGAKLDVVGSFVAPALVLLLLGIGKITKNAWCEMQKELKQRK